jgi:hypothetical protein
MHMTAVGQARFRRVEAAAEGEVVQHSILRQQRRTHIQQFIEDLDVWNPRVLGYQKYKLDRLFT